MPGPYIHISAMRATAQALARGNFQPAASARIKPEWTGADTAELARIMQRHPNFASLGAIGPDLFFFLPDFRDQGPFPLSSALIGVLRVLEGLYDALDPYIEKYERYLGPITENAAEELSRLTGGLSESVGNIAGELSGILITALENFVVTRLDLFEFFSLGLNKGFDEQAFLWSDMLHYRRTGQFARELWNQAARFESQDQQDKARAYALGYMTHVGTDVTGHALVNAISGGPFRLHWQRHHLVENHMDAFRYLRDGTGPARGGQYPQLTESALYFDIAFRENDGAGVARPTYPSGNTLRENWTRRRLLDIDSELADPIAKLLYETITAVYYKDGAHPRILREDDGKPGEDLIASSYRLLFTFLKMTTVDGFAHEPPPPPELFPNLQFPTFNDPQASAPGAGDDDSSWWDDLLDFILSIVKILLYIVQVAVYLATLPWAILADIATYPLRLGLYYALELPLFHLLKSFRAVLVMSGYLLPMDDEITVGLITVGMPDAQAFAGVLNDVGNVLPGFDTPVLDLTPFRDRLYPRLHAEDDFKHPWQYPADRGVELAATFAGPHPRRANPDVLFQNVGPDPEIRDALESAATPQAADAVGPILRANRHLGDAVGFSSYLIWLNSRQNPQPGGAPVPLVDWNLDADRGYGYHTLDFARNLTAPGVDDPEGYKFQPPCTWPSQADPPYDEKYDPSVPLNIYFLHAGVRNPGCGVDVGTGILAALARGAVHDADSDNGGDNNSEKGTS
ncbi:zinc dependent phospholipase C family protein [Massilia pseudoviolaceinigra]|uniref:zinc dependent phospholipase C family protein n=1 Tax=Massilia pseudoviolaceinigra TaxID=3057165 RepID=UPI0027967022|nr:zinc dependent phospholipase C family protein [Massilia sp. CCM 9206]MDQ1922279.1 zinc dependent phospholipase C family protein [Massilia sp. CCM 9206]